MSLTFGTGPLSPSAGARNFPIPDRAVFVQPWGRRLRAVLAGQPLFDTEHAQLLHQTGRLPAVWIPLADVDRAMLRPHGEHRGAATWDVAAGEHIAEGAVTAWRATAGDGPDLTDHVTVEFGAMDRWFDEDEPVYAHLKDPYHRVDVRAAARHVVIRHRGETVAETRRPKLLFETGLPTRYYLPVADVRLETLALSETISECPYKGDGQHWHLTVGGETVADAAWSLPHPLAEALTATDHICFYPDKVETLVDGAPVTA